MKRIINAEGNPETEWNWFDRFQIWVYGKFMKYSLSQDELKELMRQIHEDKK